MMDSPRQPRVACLGAGISGICAAVNVKRQLPHADLVLFEQDSQLGGTWWANTYPGAACDVMSHFYSFSFAPNSSWSQLYSTQPEIHSYLKHVSAKFDIDRHIRLRHRIESARWDDQELAWHLNVRKLDDGALVQHTCDILFAAPGALCAPQDIDTPGIRGFRGEAFHSARWRHDVSLQGKRVAVVGTGASAVQIVPALVPVVKELVLLQRTPSWVVPRGNYSYSAGFKALLNALPFLMILYRWYALFIHDLRFWAFIRPQPWLNWIAVKAAKAHLRRGVRDAPTLLEALTPTYTMGCKRVVVSDEFYPALCQPNVRVVSSALSSFTTRGITTANGQSIEVDAVIMATGFDVAKSFPGIPLFGQQGYSMQKAWEAAAGPEAYLGVLVPNMPNLFLLVGPNTGLGHSSIIAMIEAQVHYSMSVIQGMRARRARAVVVKQSAHDAYNKDIQANLADRVWSHCRSWYNLQGVKNASMWPHTVLGYWWATWWPRWDDIEVLRTPTPVNTIAACRSPM